MNLIASSSPCMHWSLNDVKLESNFREQLEKSYAAAENHMRNQAEHTEDAGLQIFSGTNNK
ncbi:MAG: hypothetical protein GQ549_04415 [Gammaproteobacteria bacterium]|nr:hypothetical protein [Gammaproteobacteria bacterium]